MKDLRDLKDLKTLTAVYVSYSLWCCPKGILILFDARTLREPETRCFHGRDTPKYGRDQLKPARFRVVIGCITHSQANKTGSRSART